MGQIFLHNCDRFRALYSASLDGELSEIDAARLEAHLSTCSGCNTYAVATASASRLVRETPLEQPGFRIVVPGRRLALARKFQVSAAAAAVAVTVGLSVAVGTISGPTVALVKIAAGEDPRVLPSRDGVWLKTRVQAALGTLPA